MSTVYKTAQNHIARATIGRELLVARKSLDEMNLPIEGPDYEQLQAKRTEFVGELGEMSDLELRELISNLEKRITKLQGASELQWQLIVIRYKLGGN